MNDLVRLGESLEESISSDKLKDLIEDLGDLTFEQISGAGDSLPVVSFLSKSIKAYNAVRDYFFMEKVVRYLTEIATIPYEERKETMDRISSDVKYGVKFGKKVLNIIDRLDDEIKAFYLAKAYKYLAREEITLEFYLRLGVILEGLYLANIETLKDDTVISFDSHPVNKNLERLGLANMNLKINQIENPSQAKNSNKFRVNYTNGYQFTSTGRVVNNIFCGHPIYFRSRYKNLEDFNKNVEY